MKIAKASEADLGMAMKRRVFCASLADWLDNEVPIEWLVDLLDLIRRTPHLDWLLLTKRIGNWRARVSEAHGTLACVELQDWVRAWLDGSPPANLWIGATICNQAEADRDVPKLLRMPARVRFLSIEPMLGPVDLRQVGETKSTWGDLIDARTGYNTSKFGGLRDFLPVINWVICGGESGAGSRPMHPDWVRSLRDQCAQASVPFLFKQWGDWQAETKMPDGPFTPEQARRHIATIGLNGETYEGWHRDRADDARMIRVGKKAAARMLGTFRGFLATLRTPEGSR